MTNRTRILGIVLALCAACAGKEGVDITKPVTGAEASNAERAYKRGMQEKKDKNYLEAVRYLEYVRNNFPYSQYAALAELAVADMSFERDDWGTAATQYQDFARIHPSHPQADYAAFRAGLARWEDRPSDFWLLPPASEKDQVALRNALDSLQRFVVSYPKSQYIPKARELIADLRQRLSKHEQYVVDFYWKRKAWKGAAGRLVGLADNFGDLNGGKMRSDALWRASEAYRNLNDLVAERKLLQRIVQEAPDSAHAREAQARLAQIPTPPEMIAAPPEQNRATEPAPGSVQQAPAGGGGVPNTGAVPLGNVPEPTSNPPRPSPTPTEAQPAKPTEPSK